MLADEPARNGGALGRFHRHNADHAVPRLDVLGHAGHSAAAAHTDDDGVNAVPGGLQDLRPGHPAVILRVVIVGKVVGKVAVVALGCLLGDAIHHPAAAAAAHHDFRAQFLQPLAAGNRQVTGHYQNAGVPRGGTAYRQRRAKAAGAGFHHRHTGLQSAALGSKGQHRLSQAIFGGSGSAAKVQIRQNAGCQPVAAGVSVQPHNRGTVYILIVTAQDRHEQNTPFDKVNLIIAYFLPFCILSGINIFIQRSCLNRQKSIAKLPECVKKSAKPLDFRVPNCYNS